MSAESGGCLLASCLGPAALLQALMLAEKLLRSDGFRKGFDFALEALQKLSDALDSMEEYQITLHRRDSGVDDKFAHTLQFRRLTTAEQLASTGATADASELKCTRNSTRVSLVLRSYEEQQNASVQEAGNLDSHASDAILDNDQRKGTTSCNTSKANVLIFRNCVNASFCFLDPTPSSAAADEGGMASDLFHELQNLLDSRSPTIGLLSAAASDSEASCSSDASRKHGSRVFISELRTTTMMPRSASGNSSLTSLEEEEVLIRRCSSLDDNAGNYFSCCFPMRDRVMSVQGFDVITVSNADLYNGSFNRSFDRNCTTESQPNDSEIMASWYKTNTTDPENLENKIDYAAESRRRGSCFYIAALPERVKRQLTSFSQSYSDDLVDVQLAPRGIYDQVASVAGMDLFYC